LVKAIKFPRVAFIFSKLILFAGFAFFLWKQLSSSDISNQVTTIQHVLSLLLAFFLMPLNWWFEWRKWELINSSGEQVGTMQKWQGFLAGYVTAMLTPGLVGNFIGRSFYSDKNKRPEIVFFTLVANLSQFVVSLIFGLGSLLLLKQTPFSSLSLANVLMPTIFLVFCGLILYFFAGKPWKLIVRFIPTMQLDSSGAKLKLPFIVLSVLRHLVFTLQFMLVLHAFGAVLSWELIFWIWQVYLFVTLVPSLFMGKVIIRDSIAVFVLTSAHIGIQSMGVFAASFSVWMINLFIPFIFALLLLKRKSYVDSADV